MLREYSKKGYHFKKITGCFYVLEKGEPKDYIYSVDYHTLKNTEFEEYKEIIDESGWTLLQKFDYILLLRALPNTAPLYTDKQTLCSREERFSNKLTKSMIGCVFLILFCILFQIYFLAPIINSKSFNFVMSTIIGAMTGFTFVFSIGVFKIRRKVNRDSK